MFSPDRDYERSFIGAAQARSDLPLTSADHDLVLYLFGAETLLIRRIAYVD